MAARAAEPVQRIEIVADRRRSYDGSFRSLVVAESSVAGAKVQDVAQRHGICPSLIYRWRRASGATPEATAPGFVPVRITGESLAVPAAVSPAGGLGRRARGTIEIELTSGTRLRVDETVSLSALRRVLGALRD